MRMSMKAVNAIVQDKAMPEGLRAYSDERWKHNIITHDWSSLIFVCSVTFQQKLFVSLRSIHQYTNRRTSILDNRNCDTTYGIFLNLLSDCLLSLQTFFTGGAVLTNSWLRRLESKSYNELKVNDQDSNGMHFVLLNLFFDVSSFILRFK